MSSIPSFTVDKAELKKEFEGKQGGTFVVYTVALKDGDGVTAAELVQKQASPTPKPGDVLEGTLEKTDYGMKFKRAQNFGGKGGGGKSPAERAEIRRMHSQEMGLRLLDIELRLGKLTELAETKKASELLLPRVDFFDEDAIAAGSKA